MDVTPSELRGSDIKEAWRGYHRDEVDELLERAAVTIENLSQQLATAGSAPMPETAAVVNRDDAEISHRTLLLAQRAADEAVAEAQAHARKLIDDSEARAQSLVSEAEASARRIAESERRRLEAEIQELASRRDALRSDADALEEYGSGYRDRLRAAIEADLDRLGTGTIEPPSERPELHDIVVPPTAAPAAGYAATAEPDFEPERVAERGAAGGVDELETRAITIDAPVAEAHAEPASSPVAAPPRPSEVRPAEPEWPPPASQAATGAGPSTRSWLAGTDDWAPAEAEAEDDALPWERQTEVHEPFTSEVPPWERKNEAHEPFASDVPMEATAVNSDALDDDAFFASLRDAVRSDEMGGADEPMPFFDDELADDRRRGFRRRR